MQCVFRLCRKPGGLDLARFGGHVTAHGCTFCPCPCPLSLRRGAEFGPGGGLGRHHGPPERRNGGRIGQRGRRGPPGTRAARFARLALCATLWAWPCKECGGLCYQRGATFPAVTGGGCAGTARAPAGPGSGAGGPPPRWRPTRRAHRMPPQTEAPFCGAKRHCFRRRWGHKAFSAGCRTAAEKPLSVAPPRRGHEVQGFALAAGQAST